MKLDFIKLPGGVLTPIDEMTAEQLKRIKNNTMVTVDVKQPINWRFRRKAFALAKKAFQYWGSDNTKQKYMSESQQFEEFRKELTIVAGYYDEVYDLSGNLRLVAKSWSFAGIGDEEFQHFYTALWNAIAAKIVQLDDSEWMMDF